jgi:hypothetical protein
LFPESSVSSLISLHRQNYNHLLRRSGAVITLRPRWMQQNILSFGLVYTKILTIKLSQNWQFINDKNYNRGLEGWLKITGKIKRPAIHLK